MKTSGCFLAETSDAELLILDETTHKHWVPKSVIVTKQMNIKTFKISDIEIEDWWWDKNGDNGTPVSELQIDL